MTSRRIGVLGGTFDPIHVGHLDVGRAACRVLELARVLVITANIPPHRPQPVASSYHRFAMAAMAVNGMNGWRASDLELRAGAQSFTAGTLRQLHERGYAASDLVFILGADAFLEIGSWKDYPAILDQAHFAVVSRPGFPVESLATRLPQLAERMRVLGDGRRSALASEGPVQPMIWLADAPTADISSTAIRDRRAAGLTIAGMVPAAVEQHIEQHGLYTSKVPDRREGRSRPSMPSSEAGRLHGQG
jgi:nicotinate-nucleotide adenylyltransferase